MGPRTAVCSLLKHEVRSAFAKKRRLEPNQAVDEQRGYIVITINLQKKRGGRGGGVNILYGLLYSNYRKVPCISEVLSFHNDKGVSQNTCSTPSSPPLAHDFCLGSF